MFFDGYWVNGLQNDEIKYRSQKFKEVCANIPLPPEPIITRSGTWLEAASYYDIVINRAIRLP